MLAHSTWSDPLPTPFNLKHYLDCQPKFDLGAWLKDTSTKMVPGCPTTRLADCADTDFDVSSSPALERLRCRGGDMLGTHVKIFKQTAIHRPHTPYGCMHASTQARMHKYMHAYT